MGRNIALHALLHGESVRLHEISASVRADILPQMRAAVELMLRHALRPPPNWEQRLTVHAALPEAVAGAELVIEAIPEDLQAKQ